jgi:uncharacterized protein (TIGR03067 family)/prepilin-type processing-associated H-X9-DG protein
MNISKWTTTCSAVVLVAGLGAVLTFGSYQVLWSRQPDAPAAQPAALQTEREQPKKKAGKKTDKDRIVGVWRIKSGTANGQEMPAKESALMRLTFSKDGTLAISVIEERKNGKYNLVGDGKIDLEGPGEQQDNTEGIYKFDGNDLLTLCIKEGGDKKRPTEFSAEKGSSQVLIALQRCKPDEEKPSKEEIAKLTGGVDKVREAVDRTQSANNLKQIGLAFHNFHDTYKGFPAHAIYSKDGKTPLLSWRVAILPFIDEADLYQQFKLDEPWDSPHNKKLIPKMPKMYGALGKAKKGEGLTYYQVFTGPGTVFDGNKQMRIAQITDGTSNTMLAVEAKNGVVWSRPDDLKLPKEGEKLPALGGMFTNGFNVLFCDGSVRFMSYQVPAQTLRAVITPAGGEVIGDDLDK